MRSVLQEILGGPPKLAEEVVERERSAKEAGAHYYKLEEALALALEAAWDQVYELQMQANYNSTNSAVTSDDPQIAEMWESRRKDANQIRREIEKVAKMHLAARKRSGRVARRLGQPQGF